MEGFLIFDDMLAEKSRRKSKRNYFRYFLLNSDEFQHVKEKNFLFKKIKQRKLLKGKLN